MATTMEFRVRSNGAPADAVYGRRLLLRRQVQSEGQFGRLRVAGI